MGRSTAENARTFRLPSRDAGSSARDSREVAQPAFWPGSVRGCSQVSSVHRISLVIVSDAGANIVMMSERCSVENGMESATSPERSAGMEAVGGMVGVIKDPGLNMSWKKDICLFLLPVAVSVNMVAPLSFYLVQNVGLFIFLFD